MFVGKAILLFFVFCDSIHELKGLDILIPNEDKIIETTDSILRNTTIRLFSELRFNNWNKRLKHALLVHNFFTSVTLTDHNTLNKIIKITRVERGDNETEQYMTALNDILNEDYNSTEEQSSEHNDDYILQYVDEFLSNLNGFKQNIIEDEYRNLAIKDEIIHILTSEDATKFNPKNQNMTEKSTNDSDSGYASDNEFWAPEQETRRIYNGKAVKIKYFPFMASIHIFNGFQCAGSIIHSDLILTAASCLQLAWNNRFFRENPAFLSVRVGSDFYTGGGEQVPVMEVYFHPGYNPRNLRNNIAILRLIRHLKFRKRKKRLRKIAIDQHASALPTTTSGISIVGWGARGVQNIVLDPWSNRLAYSVLDIYDLFECKEIYSKDYVTNTNFCAGFLSKGGGACNHDVGGPGVVNGILVGIISFGSPVCGTPDAPTVFTKVGYYNDWIEEIMEQEVPYTMKRTTMKIYKPQLTPAPPHIPDPSFKIAPIGGSLKPLPLSEADTLRILEDENLLKDFLTTMFTSKEADDFTDILLNNDAPVKKSNDEVQEQKEFTKRILETKPKKQAHKEMKKTKLLTTEIHEESNPVDEELHELATNAGYHTRMEPYDSDKEKSVTLNMFGSGAASNDDYYAIDENVIRMIDEITESEENTEKNKVVTIKNSVSNAITKLHITEPPKLKSPSTPAILKKSKENVMTILYVSDDETGNDTIRMVENDIEDFDDNISEGIPISVDGFRDFTFRTNVTSEAKSKSVLDFMSRNELYDLLSEAIEEVAKYKRSQNRLPVFCLLSKQYLFSP